MARKILMIPGPTEVYPEALAAMAQPIMPHYGGEFLSIYLETCEGLKKIFETTGEVVLLVGPGTSAMEASATTIIEEGDKVINVRNGFFGDRFHEVIMAVGGKPVDVTAEPGKIVDPEAVRRRIKQEKDVKAIFLVHNETSTGVVNPVPQVGEVAQEHDLIYVVDGISSVGGIEMRMDEWNIDLCFTGSQKCLGAPPGLAPMAISKRLWEGIDEGKKSTRGWYLNLKTWRKYAMEWGWHPYPTSLATHSIRALHIAVKMALNEGLENRYCRHRVAGEALREGLKAMGLQLLSDGKHASPTITVPKIPPNIDAAKLQKTVEDRFNILIAGGLTELKGKVLRIGHMSMTASPEYIIPTVAAMEYALLEQGFDLKRGAGPSATMGVFRSRTMVP